MKKRMDVCEVPVQDLHKGLQKNKMDWLPVVEGECF
jgi:hypothetical protein